MAQQEQPAARGTIQVEQARSDAGMGPYQVALCTLLRICLLPESYQIEMTADKQQALEAMLLQKMAGGETAWQASLSDLLDDIQACLGNGRLAEDVAAAVLEQLAALSCPDDMLTFFTEMSDACQPGIEVGGEPQHLKIAPQSAMGIFIRRSSVSFSMLPFEGVCQLFSEVQAYLSQCQEAQLSLGLESSLPRSQLQRRAALEELLNKEIGSIELELGRRPAEELGVLAADLDSAQCDLPRAHLLRHTLAVQQEDYLDALESLHRYFDYSAGPPSDRSEADAAESGQFQSALLSLGAMHAHFGHVQHALLALNETVRMAQQHSDDSTLAHALAQLCRLLAGTTPAAASAASGDGSSAAHHRQLHRLLQRCLKRGKELQLPHLVAFARLALAQFTWQHRMIPPTKSTGTPSGKPGGLEDVESAVREVAALQQSVTVAAAVPGASLSTAHGLPNARSVADLFAAQQPVFGELLTGCEASAAAAVQQLAGSSLLLRSAAWSQSGCNALAEADSVTFLSCYGDTARSEDACLAYAQLARLAAESQGFGAATQILAMADEEYPHAQDRVLTAARLAIGHQRELNRRELHQAEHLAEQICALAPPSGTQYLNIKMEGERRLVETLMAAGRLEEAEQAAGANLATCVEAGLQGEATALLLCLAKIHQQAGAANSALPYALSCEYHAKQLGYELLAAEVGILLADLKLAISPCLAKQTQSQLLRFLPLVLGEGGRALQAQLHSSLAHALLAGSSQEDLGTQPEKVLEHLSAATEKYEAQEDWQHAAEASYLAALVSSAAGLTGRRNRAAAAFQRLTTLAQEVY